MNPALIISISLPLVDFLSEFPSHTEHIVSDLALKPAPDDQDVEFPIPGSMYQWIEFGGTYCQPSHVSSGNGWFIAHHVPPVLPTVRPGLCGAQLCQM